MELSPFEVFIDLKKKWSYLSLKNLLIMKKKMELSLFEGFIDLKKKNEYFVLALLIEKHIGYIL